MKTLKLIRLYNKLKIIGIVSIVCFGIYAVSPKNIRVFTSVFGLIGAIGLAGTFVLAALISGIEIIRVVNGWRTSAITKSVGFICFHCVFAMGMLFCAFFIVKSLLK